MLHQNLPCSNTEKVKELSHRKKKKKQTQNECQQLMLGIFLHVMIHSATGRKHGIPMMDLNATLRTKV